MKLEIKKVTQQEFDSYWTPEVCNLLNQYIQNTKRWAADFDEQGNCKYWVIDEDRQISYIGLNILGADHPSQLTWQDMAVVAKDGSVSLMKHRYDESFNDVYEVILLTGQFESDPQRFYAAVRDVLLIGGSTLSGKKDKVGALVFSVSEIVTFK